MGCGASKQPAPLPYEPSGGTLRRIDTTKTRVKAAERWVEKIKPPSEPEKGEPKGEPKGVLRKLFRDLDADNSDSVTASLLVKCLRADRRVSLALHECGGEELLKTLDANADGTITWVEFEAGLGVVAKPPLADLSPTPLDAAAVLAAEESSGGCAGGSRSARGGARGDSTSDGRRAGWLRPARQKRRRRMPLQQKATRAGDA